MGGGYACRHGHDRLADHGVEHFHQLIDTRLADLEQIAQRGMAGAHQRAQLGRDMFLRGAGEGLGSSLRYWILLGLARYFSYSYCASFDDQLVWRIKVDAAGEKEAIDPL